MKPLRRKSGVTLVEMMIALVLGTVLIGGVAQIFLSSRQSFSTQTGLGAIQENGRFALQFVQRDVRSAGYPKNAVNTVPGIVAATPSDTGTGGFDGNFALTRDGGAGASDTLTLAYDSDPSYSSTTRYVVGDGVIYNNVQYIAVQGSPAPLTPDNTNHQPDSSPTWWALQQTSSAADCLGSTVTHADPSNTAPARNRIYVSYFRTVTNGVGVLMCRGNGNSASPAVVASGVDAFEVLYGEDTDADTFPNVYRTAAQVGSWNNVVSVRVGLLMSSRDQQDASQASQTSDAKTYAVLDETFGPFNDRNLRRVFNSTIEIRNRTL